MFEATRRWLPFFAAVLLLIVAVVMLFLMLGPARPVQDARGESALSADSARWEALGRYYTRERALSADSARWEALGR